MDISLAVLRKTATVFILFIANLLNYMDRYILFGILIEIQEFYSMSDFQAGLLQTMFLVSYIACSMIFGTIGDSVSRKYLVIIGTTLWSAFTLIGSFVPANRLGLFYVCRSLVGTGEASISTLGLTLIGDYFTDKARTRSISIFTLASPLGSGIGYLLGPQIMRWTGKWQWAMRVTPGIGIITVIAMMVVMKEPKRGEAESRKCHPILCDEQNDNRNTGQNGEDTLLGTGVTTRSTVITRFYRSNIKYFLTRWSFVYATLGYTGVSFVFGGLAVWLPKYFVMVNTFYVKIMGHFAKSENIMLLFGTFTVVTGITGVYIGGELIALLMPRYKRVELYICVNCCLISSVVLFLAIYFSLTNLAATWVFVVMTLMCLALMWTPNNNLIMSVVGPSHRSRACAMQILTIHAFGDAISPVLIGLISDLRKVDPSSGYWNVKSLNEALYLTPFVMIVSAMLYTAAMWSFESDANKTKKEVLEMSRFSEDEGVTM